MEKDTLISNCKILIIGGSAGSLDVLIKILPHLDIPSFALVIVLHRKHTEDNTLEELIAAKSIIPLKEVEDKVEILPGYIYIAPSDYHLLFEKNNLLSLDTSEKVNYSRPSIDVAFESVADAYGKAVVGVLLSGANADGTDGLIAIKNAGGIIIVQQPETADMPFMPSHAVQNTSPDFIVDIPALLDLIKRINS
ncbi:chemotaxis protein CheB [Flavobacterium soli]|uniref:chemotaxis protein CheB n=1 Tax=Flavobacterium soli TaxID=344881 RepID=UPI00041F518E|nr:chemotaxis protein CheB [Flavobacterium soli]